MIDQFPNVPKDEWGFLGMYPYVNADEVLSNLSPEAKALMLKVMQKCLEDHSYMHVGREFGIGPNCAVTCADVIVDCDCDYCTKWHFGCEICEIHAVLDSPENLPCPHSPNLDDHPIVYLNAPEPSKAHKWGPENIRITGLSRFDEDKGEDGLNKWGHDLYVELLYTYGTPHEWLASYGVNTVTGEMSCYAD